MRSANEPLAVMRPKAYEMWMRIALRAVLCRGSSRDDRDADRPAARSAGFSGHWFYSTELNAAGTGTRKDIWTGR